MKYGELCPHCVSYHPESADDCPYFAPKKMVKMMAKTVEKVEAPKQKTMVKNSTNDVCHNCGGKNQPLGTRSMYCPKCKI